VKIDIYTHIVPRKYWEAVIKKVGYATLEKYAPGRVLSVESTQTLWNLEKRFEIMDRYDGLIHVLTPSGPSLELVSQPSDTIHLARLYNDEMAELVTKYGDRFLAAVACLPMNDVDAALEEIDRTVKELGFKGILMNTPLYVNGVRATKPIDLPEFMPIYELMMGYGLPIWIHPAGEVLAPDYLTEDRSKYMIFQCFGWPHDTTVAMARLVYSGILEKYPHLKVITHHCGAMIPYLSDRIKGSCEWYETCLKSKFTKKLGRSPLEYFKRFYNDTALYGNTPALMCARAFFGAGHLLFGTDFPYDSELGNRYTMDTIHAIELMDIPDSERQMIFESNARTLLDLHNRQEPKT